MSGGSECPSRISNCAAFTVGSAPGASPTSSIQIPTRIAKTYLDMVRILLLFLKVAHGLYLRSLFRGTALTSLPGPRGVVTWNLTKIHIREAAGARRRTR